MSILSDSDLSAVRVHSRATQLVEAVRGALSGCGVSVHVDGQDEVPETAAAMSVHIHDASFVDTLKDRIPPRMPRLMVYERLHAVLLEGAVYRGFRGFLSLSRVPERVCEAVSLLASGQAFLDHEALELLLERNGTVTPRAVHHDESLLDELTPRERQVFEALVRGQSPKQIGESFGISERTVEVHRRRILERLGLSNVVQLFHLAFQAGIVTREELLEEFSPHR